MNAPMITQMKLQLKFFPGAGSLLGFWLCFLVSRTGERRGPMEKPGNETMKPTAKRVPSCHRPIFRGCPLDPHAVRVHILTK
jgi:hypothetical protein